MNTNDLIYIVDIEMMKFGEISKGIRYEVTRMALGGRPFEVTVSSDDCTNICATLRRKGESWRVTTKKVGAGKKMMTFNAEEE